MRRIEALGAENAQLRTAVEYLRNELDGERMQRGVVGIIATVLTAIGGGFVSVYPDWKWLFACMIIILYSYMLFSSIVNLSSEVREFGLIGSANRLLRGRG
jgi:hypothetical protein